MYRLLKQWCIDRSSLMDGWMDGWMVEEHMVGQKDDKNLER